MLVNAIKVRQPKARVLLLGLFPREEKEERMMDLNTGIASLANSKNLDYVDIGGALLGKDQKIDAGLFSDGLHPNAKGYRKLGKLLRLALEMGKN
jgi:lysophospholipase L1-like esterase